MRGIPVECMELPLATKSTRATKSTKARKLTRDTRLTRCQRWLASIRRCRCWPTTRLWRISRRTRPSGSAETSQDPGGWSSGGIDFLRSKFRLFAYALCLCLCFLYVRGVQKSCFSTGHCCQLLIFSVDPLYLQLSLFNADLSVNPLFFYYL